MAKVTLDMETFKALASDTRLGVLRALDERRKTLTELSKELDLNKATVHEHLALLTTTGLIKKRDDEGRKWIYYELTWRGERLLHPETTTTFAVLLGVSVAAAGGGVALLGRALDWWWAERQLNDSLGEPVDDGAGADTAEADMAGAEEAPQEPSDGQANDAPQDESTGRAESAPADGDFAAEDAASSDFGDDGVLALLLLATSILLAVLAFTVRKFRRNNA